MYSMNINGVKVEINAWNCAIFIFPPEFASHNHIFVMADPDDEEGIYIFGRPDIIDILRKTGDFPVHYLPYVPDNDIAAHERWIDEGGTRQNAIEATAEEVAPLTEEEVNYYAKEFQEDRVIDHWDELDD